MTFPAYVDSTMRASFVACPAKFFAEYIMNRRHTSPSVHLNAGKAFAKGVEIARLSYWDKQLSEPEAILEGQLALFKSYVNAEQFADENKCLPRMLLALEAYFKKWGFGGDHFMPYKLSNASSALEFSFSIPIEDCRHPETGDPILYCGRFDWIAQHCETGALYAADEKTTSQLGATWPLQWRHRAQLTGYVWAGRQYGIDLQGALIRGISILKNDFGHAESLQIRTQFYIERWYQQIISDINRMIACYERNYFDFNFSDSCNSYSAPCSYTDACSSSRYNDFLKANFEHHRWNPLKHQVEELNDQDEVVRIVE